MTLHTRIATAVASTVVMLLVAIPSWARPGDGWIDLHARDSDRGRGIAATMTLTSNAGAELRLTLPPSGRRRVALAPGEYSIEATEPGYTALQTRAFVTLGETVSMTLWLDPRVAPEECTAADVASRRIRGVAMLYGHIVDPDRGVPVEGATVELEGSGAFTETDTDGSFELRVPVPVTASPDDPTTDVLVVRGPGYRTYRQRGVALTDGDTHLIVDLHRGRDTDVDEYDGRPKVLRSGDELLEAEVQAQDPATAVRFERAAVLRPRARAGGAEVTRAVSGVWAPPSTIRVGFDCSCTSCATVQVFALETYVKRGLNDEWIASWSQHALRAGAVPYRSYAVWHVFNPIHANYDICSTTCCQVNDADTSSGTDLAVDRTPGIMLEAAGSILRSEYSAENNGWDDPGDGLSCANVDLSCGDGFAGSPSAGWPCLLDSPGSGHGCFGHGRGMCQWGTQRWAVNQGRLWGWTVDHYYNDNDNPSGMRSGYMTSPLEIFNATPDDVGVEAETTFGIDLDLANLASLDHSQVLIGASLWSSATGYIDDPSNDQSTSLSPGSGSVSRSFDVPAGTPEGAYDLLTALWLDVDEDGSITGLDLPMHTVNVEDALEVCSAPVAVGESVRLVRVAPDSVELTWSATSNATSYTVQRSTAPSSGFGPVGTTAGTMWIDPSAGAALLFYEVESANACGQSGF